MADLERLLADLRYVAQPPRNAPDAELLVVLQRLDGVAHDPRAELPERLRHFLERRSYSKALTFAEAMSEESGA